MPKLFGVIPLMDPSGLYSATTVRHWLQSTSQLDRDEAALGAARDDYAQANHFLTRDR
jgi:hypothetical protein